jgi:hypothetical protein
MGTLAWLTRCRASLGHAQIYEVVKFHRNTSFLSSIHVATRGLCYLGKGLEELARHGETGSVPTDTVTFGS